MTETAAAPSGPRSPRIMRAGALGVFLASFALFLTIHLTLPVLFDSDAYYHLSVARTYLEKGPRTDFPQARYSAMRDGFGDKEPLFHLLLAPAAAAGDPLRRGAVALALFDALVLTAIGLIAARIAGAWGLLVPFWLLATSVHFTVRLMSLRPELLSFLLICAALWVAGTGRYRTLGILGALYALSYTAFQAFLGLCLLWFLAEGWAGGRWRWRSLLYPAAGVAAGLLIHPQFPANLRVWYLQNVAFFRYKGVLDVGSEILSPGAGSVLLLNAGWLAGLVVLWRSAAPPSTDPPAADPASVSRLSRAAWPAAIAFGLLFLLMERFGLYAVPFVTFALLAELRRRGLHLTRWVPLPWRGRVPLVLALGLCLLTLPRTARFVAATLEKGAVLVPERRADWEAFARAVPPGAAVAAPWMEAETYVFFAPRGRYLNVLDPVFMAVPYPREYRIQRALFRGETLDAPLAAARLQSPFVAFSPLYPDRGRLFEQLADDPRARLLYGGLNMLFEIVPGENGRFLLDWSARPASGDEGERPPWVTWPRSEDPRERAVEGFVDAARLGGSPQCVDFSRVERFDRGVRVFYEIASPGRSILWVDGRLAAETGGVKTVAPGRGLMLPVSLERGAHRFTVRTCRAGGRAGFYFLERRRAPLP